MAGDEGRHLMFFQGLMQRHGSTSAHAFALPGFPPQIHLPMPGDYPPPPRPGAYTCAGPGYAYAQANACAYPPPPAGPYAYPPQGYPHPGLPAPPHQDHGIRFHGGGRQMERMQSKPKAGGGTAATASATAAYGGINAGHGSSGGHGGRREVEVIESAPKTGGTAAASASASVYGALDKLSRGHAGNRTGTFGFLGNCCGDHRGTLSFKHADDHGHRGKFKRGHLPSKVKHVQGKFQTKSATWNY